MAITRVKIRARVEVGGISVETPYVQSFNVRKQRGQISTFDASLKVPSGTAKELAGGDVRIYAGENSASDLIFTGICRAAKVSPCYDDPNYVLLSVSGADVLSQLQGKKFTRRCRATNSVWCSITGITRKGLKSGSLARTNEGVIIVNDGQLKDEDNTVGFVQNNSLSSNPRKVPEDGSVWRKITSFVTPVKSEDEPGEEE